MNETYVRVGERGGETVDASTLFELLTKQTRREILVRLCDVASFDVSDELGPRDAVRATAEPSGEPTADSSRATAPETIKLYHSHLPKLDEAGVVDWDPDSNVVARGPAFPAVEPTIRLLTANESVLPGRFV